MHGSKTPTSGQIINENFVAEAWMGLHTGIDDQDNMARLIDNICIISYVPAQNKLMLMATRPGLSEQANKDRRFRPYRVK